MTLEEAIYYKSEDLADFERTLTLYTNGVVEAELIDGVHERYKYNRKQIPPSKVKALTARVYRALYSNRNYNEANSGNYTIIRAVQDGESRGIGFGDITPPGLTDIEESLLDIHKTLISDEDVEWKPLFG